MLHAVTKEYLTALATEYLVEACRLLTSRGEWMLVGMQAVTEAWEALAVCSRFLETSCSSGRYVQIAVEPEMIVRVRLDVSGVPDVWTWCLLATSGTWSCWVQPTQT